MSLYHTNEVIESNVPSGGQLSVLPPYLERSHIKVYEGAVLLVDGVDYEWTTSQSLTALRGLTAPIQIRRVTPGETLLSGSTPMSYFDPEAMLVAQKQALYIAQELEDDAASVVADAQVWAEASQLSAESSYASEYQAGLHKDAAAGSATAAAGSASTALGHANTASGHATTALGHANTAGGHKDAAQAAAATAQAYAYHGNYIINGTFQIAQRASSQTSNGYGSADRWSLQHSGSSKTASILSLGGDTSGIVHYLRHDITSVANAGSFVNAVQKVEGLKQFAGKTIVLSWYAKAGTAGHPMSVEFSLNYGTGGSASTQEEVYGSVVKVSLTTGWVRYSTVLTIPDLSSKTFDGADDWLGVRFWFEAGSNYDSRTSTLGQRSCVIDISNVMLEEGSTPTTFKFPNLALELERCQRYYFRGILTGGGEGAHYTNITATFLAGPFIIFPTRMRVTPTVTTITAPTLGNCALGSTRVNTTYFYQLIDVQTAPSLYRAYGGLYAFDAEL